MYLEMVKPEPAWLMAIQLVNNIRSILNKKDAGDQWELRFVIMSKSLLSKVLYQHPLINLYDIVLRVISTILSK